MALEAENFYPERGSTLPPAPHRSRRADGGTARATDALPLDREAYTQELPLTSEHEARLRGVLRCLDHLDALARHPEMRTAHVIAVSEPILDVFNDASAVKPNREGGNEVIVDSEPQYMLGGGANVVLGLSNFARQVDMVIRVGEPGPANPYGHVLEEQLAELPDNVRIRAIKQRGTSDAVKVRYQNADGHVVAGVRYNPRPVDQITEEAIAQAIAEAAQSTDVNSKVVVSDYGRGMVTRRVLEAVSEQVPDRDNVHVVLDPRPSADAAKNEKYNVKGAVPTPNRDEAQDLSGVVLKGLKGKELDAAAHEAGRAILARFPDLAGTLITADRDGSYFIKRDGSIIHMPAAIHPSREVNPSGAGDIVVSTLALLPEDMPVEDRLNTAMYLAGNSVKREGTTTLAPDLVQEVRAMVQAELAFRTGYEFSTARNNKALVPHEAAPVMAAKLGRPELTGDILRILRSPEVQLYPDTEPFMERVMAMPDTHVAIWTQGEAIAADDGSDGYQLLKLQASAIHQQYHALWREKAAESTLPHVIAGIDKHASLPDTADRMAQAGITTAVFLDDRLPNVTGALQAYAESPVQAVGVLVDRKGKYQGKEVPPGVIVVSHLGEVEVDALAQGRTALMVDLDETQIDHEATKYGMIERVAALLMQDETTRAEQN